MKVVIAITCSQKAKYSMNIASVYNQTLPAPPAARDNSPEPTHSGVVSPLWLLLDVVVTAKK